MTATLAACSCTSPAPAGAGAEPARTPSPPSVAPPASAPVAAPPAEAAPPAASAAPAPSPGAADSDHVGCQSDKAVAERAYGGIAQEVVSALSHRRYDKLAHFVGPEGLCLRATKDAPCETLSPPEVASCGTSRKARPWNRPGAPAELSCAEAMRRIFYERDFLRTAEVRFDCFPGPEPGGETAPVVRSATGRGQVHFLDAGRAGLAPASLWLVFDGEGDALALVQMIRE